MLLQLDFSTILVFVVVFLLFWYLLQQKWRRCPYPLPPSPPYPLPVLGHLYLMSRDPRESFKAWREQFGDIFSLKLGPHTMVVLSSYQLLKDAFIKHGEVFNHRPSIFIMERVGYARGLILSSGEIWKEQRRVALEILREFGLGQNILAEKIQEEVVDYLKALDGEKGKAMDISTPTHLCVANIICSIVFGKRYEHGDPFFIERMSALMSNMRDVGGDAAILNFMPYLRFLPGDRFRLKRIAKNAKLMDDFCKDVYEEHIQNFDENNVTDFVSAYIRESKKKQDAGMETTLDEKNLTQVIGDLFAAGMETTATTLCWAVVFLLHHPHVQDKCFEEISRVVGSGRLPNVQDKLELPYVEATIMEIQRLSNLVPFGVLHSTARDTVFHGYFIPKNAIILPLMESVLSDERVFTEPKAFKPERFLDAEGKLIRPDEFIPFSLGRRVCLGESLARMELFLFLSAMIQRFTFKLPEGEQLPSLQGILGTTLSPQLFNVCAIPRQ